MSATGNPVDRLEALVARGRALEQRAREVEATVRELLPPAGGTGLVTAEVDETGTLRRLVFSADAASCTTQELEDAVNHAVASAQGPPLVGPGAAAGLLATVAAHGLPRPAEHVTADGAVRVQVVLGRPGRITLHPRLAETLSLSALADAVVAAHRGAVAAVRHDGGPR